MKKIYLIVCILAFFFCGFVIGKLTGKIIKQDLEIKSLKQNALEQEEEKEVYMETIKKLEKILERNNIKFKKEVYE